eukprot:TRINITY_DN11576_c0_g1_i1.p1 TRINITY_DN11576_c0_g1~~TRINITY_DN11576_c0_g1_i1.p1  ORF type:complete len:273 (-),score=21.00 TRINITY_DN11576_c0_g1_i1:75-893(-)
MSRRITAQWHRKAKWMVKNVLIRPPTSSTEMRNLCNTIIEKRHGADSPSTAIVSTALSLWDDPNLVNALQNNELFRNAKERIERTAYHLLPSSHHHHHASHLSSASQVFNEVFSCPVCGNNLKCASDHTQNCDPNYRKEEGQTLLSLEELSLAEMDPKSPKQLRRTDSGSAVETDGTAGRLPDSFDDSDSEKRKSPASENVRNKVFRLDLKTWFGPLVLASFALVGIACKVYTGEISLLNAKNLSARAFVAITTVLQASNSVLGFLNAPAVH